MKKNSFGFYAAVFLLVICISVSPAIMARAESSAEPDGVQAEGPSLYFSHQPDGTYLPFATDLTVTFSAGGLDAYEGMNVYAALNAEPFPMPDDPGALVMDESCVEEGAVTISLPVSHPGSFTVIICLVDGETLAERYAEEFFAYLTKVTFDAQGGSDVAPVYRLSLDSSTFALPDGPERTGYTFSGWYTESTGGVEVTSPAEFTSDVTLYAHWIADPAAPTEESSVPEEDSRPEEGNVPEERGSSEEFIKPEENEASRPKYLQRAETSLNFSASVSQNSLGNATYPGKWTQDISGIWHYSSTGMAENSNAWGRTVNPYGSGGQNVEWFYFDRYGNMLTGWQLIAGKWYYLNPTNSGTLGACLMGPGMTPDGYEIDASGAWIGR